MIAVAALAAVWPALNGGFLWDDQQLILENGGVHGLDAARIGWMFSTLYMSTYQPLGWLAYAAIHSAAGLSPTAYHAVSLALHAAAALLLFAAARRLFIEAGREDPVWPAAAAALLWAVHPIQTATVAWATEIPDQLATIFFLAAILVYLTGRSPRRLGAAWLLFVCSGLSRWKGISLPLVLLVLDFYPLRRLRPRRGDPLDWGRRDVWGEKLAFAAVSVGILFANSMAKAAVEFSPSLNLSAIARGVLLYPWKLIWPADLLPTYALQSPGDTLSLPGGPASALVAAVTAWLVAARRRLPAALAAWTCYIAAVAPPLMGAQLGVQFALAHHAYLSSMGLFILAGAALDRLRRAARPALAIGLAAAAALSWGVQSREFCAYWGDETLFWTRALSIDRGCLTAYGNLGAVLVRSGRYNDAWFWLDRASRVDPRDPFARYNLIALKNLAPGLKPDLVAFWIHMAADQLRLGRLEDAARLCAKALQRRPRSPEAHETMAACLTAQGLPGRAESHRAAAKLWRSRAAPRD